MKINKVYLHILYWVIAIFFLSAIFGRSWGNTVEAFYFICLLLPVIMATSYFFIYYLVPEFLLQGRYFLFALYFVYMVIVSLFLEMIVLIFTFILLIQYNFGEMGRNAHDTLLLAIVMYLIVFFTAFLIMTRQLIVSHNRITNLKENSDKLKRPFLQIVSQRRSVRIPFDEIQYIESYSDFIKIISDSAGEIISKERISAIEKTLPDTFLRIHRSFIVNLEKVTRFDYNGVEINGITITIGRTYKKHVLGILKESGKSFS